jgi:hypothetical protein
MKRTTKTKTTTTTPPTTTTARPVAVPPLALPNPDRKPGPVATVKALELGDAEIFVVDAIAIQAAVLCTSKDSNRSFETGVLFREREGSCELVATNGNVMLVQRLPGKVPSWAKGEGVVVERELLGKLAKLQGEGGVSLSYGKHHPHVLGSTAPDYARFKLPTVTTKFPDYVNIIAGGQRAMQGSEVAPLSAPSIDPAYVKVAAQIGAILEAKGIFTFLSHEKTASVFTFGEKAAAALYVMPLADAGSPFSPAAVKMLAPALRGSAAALKAHITRTVKASRGASESDKKKLAVKRAELEARLKSLAASGVAKLEDKRDNTPAAR